MSAPESDRPRLLTRGFWAMMVLASLSFLAAAAVVASHPHRPAPRLGPAAHVAPLAEPARDAKRAPPQSSFGPP